MVRKNRNSPTQRAWTDADSALWHTCKFVSQVEARQLPDLQVDTLFALRSAEVAFARGPYSLDALRTAGNGSYSHNSTFIMGSGGLGLALGAGTLIGSAIGNSNRRAQATADAQLAWRHDSTGQLVVTNQGFYLDTGSNLFAWDWGSVDSMEIIAFNYVQLSGTSTNGPVTWRIASPWAELVFVLWAMGRHARHPQLVQRMWIPANWSDWARAQGYPNPLLPSRVPVGKHSS
ncbi:MULTISPECIES: hypothetical protein [Plantibacter]|uniref:hypothetical protein n=1 Tax=Plantibacter TaxID=190323 RepID=UPI0010C1882F|nr:MULTISPECIES: hypothetical protein [Plantibacter]MBD8467250.1 hypothetical protein [Plantibacter sp. CFBP 8798]